MPILARREDGLLGCAACGPNPNRDLHQEHAHELRKGKGDRGGEGKGGERSEEESGGEKNRGEGERRAIARRRGANRRG